MRPRLFLPPDERERLIEQLQALMEADADIQFATLFGSFLEMDLPFADIDVGLGLAPGVDPERYELDRAAEWTVALGYPVDVVVFERAPLGLQVQILNGRPLILRDPERFTDLIERTGWEWMHWEPYVSQFLRELLP
ncbi:nucleotidyltransferase domain-containing protein [Thermoflexus sp.]|uniref:nucleotidyltransferase domain-containing protein n=1 Tax=Thermoflexus sp. TaxID=1969742 RepID=UPI001778963E|nr:nucleotidyltransferase domain-containing protein [Thermoflexus sp.]